MIFFIMSSIFLLCVGIACLGACKFIRAENQKLNMTEWGYTFIYGSIFPLLMFFMCILL